MHFPSLLAVFISILFFHQSTAYINVRQSTPMGTQTMNQGQSYTLNCADQGTMSQSTFDQQQKVWRLNGTEFYGGTATRNLINNNKQLQFTSFSFYDVGTYDCCVLPYGATDNAYNCYTMIMTMYNNGYTQGGYTQYPGQQYTQSPNQQTQGLSAMAQLLLYIATLMANSRSAYPSNG